MTPTPEEIEDRHMALDHLEREVRYWIEETHTFPDEGNEIYAGLRAQLGADLDIRNIYAQRLSDVDTAVIHATTRQIFDAGSFIALARNTGVQPITDDQLTILLHTDWADDE